MKSRRKRSGRVRIGKVSVYLHHGAWWLYYREGGRAVRKKVSESRAQAEQLAAQVNAQLAVNSPTVLSFSPISVGALCQQFLDYHEEVRKSSIATVRRYRAATEHLVRFAGETLAHTVKPDRFAAYLRNTLIAPNGHPNTARRNLRDKGVQFILETCRAMYSFAAKRRHLPPYAGNPFEELALDRLKIEDAKPIFVFDAATELAFLRSCDEWEFPIHFTFAKTGLRVGELTHLLVEDLDLEAGWLNVRNKAELGWRIKTGVERRVPLMSELVRVLKIVLVGRLVGPVFLQRRFLKETPVLSGDRRVLGVECQARCRCVESSLDRNEMSRIARTVWRDAGAIKSDAVRQSFIRIASSIGHPEATCPKSWRHTFATLLQDANVDPLIRQQTLGHRGSTGPSLGMTAAYTHTRPETHRQQIEAALRQWPESLRLAGGGAS